MMRKLRRDDGALFQEGIFPNAVVLSASPPKLTCGLGMSRYLPKTVTL